MCSARYMYCSVQCSGVVKGQMPVSPGGLGQCARPLLISVKVRNFETFGKIELCSGKSTRPGSLNNVSNELPPNWTTLAHQRQAEHSPPNQISIENWFPSKRLLRLSILMPKGSEKLEMKILPHGEKELPANQDRPICQPWADWLVLVG